MQLLEFFDPSSFLTLEFFDRQQGNNIGKSAEAAGTGNMVSRVRGEGWQSDNLGRSVANR
jgi:hypothetical protein